MNVKVPYERFEELIRAEILLELTYKKYEVLRMKDEDNRTDDVKRKPIEKKLIKKKREASEGELRSEKE